MVYVNERNDSIVTEDGKCPSGGASAAASSQPGGPKLALTCTVKYFCVGALLIFLGSILICSLGFTIVLPHIATRDWPRVTCNVTNSTFNPNLCACMWQLVEGEPCIVEYPCLQIRVLYEPPVNFTTGMTSQVEELAPRTTVSSSDDVISDESHLYFLSKDGNGWLYRSWNDAFHEKCALYECGDSEWNSKEAERFQSAWGQPGSTFDCYVNPESPSSLIAGRTPRSSAIHAMLWPSLCVLAGSIIWLALCFGFGKYCAS